MTKVARTLGLHQITAMDVGPLELIEIAATCGYEAVSLFTNAPHVPIEGQEGKFVFPTVTPADPDLLSPHHCECANNAVVHPQTV